MRRPTRHFWLPLSGVLALALLVVPAVWLARNLVRSHALTGQLREARQQLRALAAQRPFPSATNTAVVRAATTQAGELLGQVRTQFQPLPASRLTGREFQEYLEKRIAALREQAGTAGLRLPDTLDKNYGFTLRRQHLQVPSTPESAAALSQMLAQVEWLCGTLFAAHCDLIELRRPRLPSDSTSPRAEFTHCGTATNPVARALLASYRVTVGCSSADLAGVLDSYGNAPHGVLARVLSVEQGERIVPPDRPAGSPVKRRPVSQHQPRESALKVTFQLDFVTAQD